MTPRQVRSLLAVTHYGGVNQAAKVLHLAPSSISAQLKELASELGVELFVSKGRNITLSDVGRSLLPSFQDFVDQEDGIRHKAKQASKSLSGSLTLFAPSSMCIYRLPSIIERLQSLAPKLEILLTHEPFDYEHALHANEIDAAIIVSHSEQSLWQQHRLYREEVVYAVHPQLHQPQALTVEQLNEQSIIATEPSCSYRLRVEKHFKEEKLTFLPKQSFSNVEVIKRCLLAKMGVGLLPRCVVEAELKYGSLREQAVVGTPYVFHSYLIYPKSNKISAKLAALISVIQQV
ncbi:MAG: LysR family transcriptional regulator [Cellvibrionaceae bacterium]